MSPALLLFLTMAQVPDWPEQLFDRETAVRMFVETCWRGLRDPEIFEAVIARTAPALREVPVPWGRSFTAPNVDLLYVADYHCAMRFRLNTTAEGMEVAGRLGERLGLRTPEQSWVADAVPNIAFWQFPRLPVDRSYYATRVRVRQPLHFQAQGPVEVEISVSHGAG